MAYRSEVDNVTKDEWQRILLRFEDAVIHQSWAFGAACWGEDNLSHLVVEQDGEIVAAAQVALSRLPVLRG